MRCGTYFPYLRNFVKVPVTSVIRAFNGCHLNICERWASFSLSLSLVLIFPLRLLYVTGTQMTIPARKENNAVGFEEDSEPGERFC